MMILAEKIAMLRRKNGWSQEELAHRLNVSRQSVSKWESAASVPDLDKILLLSQIFDVSTDYLLKDSVLEETPAPEEIPPEGALPTVTMEDANRFLELSGWAAGRYAGAVAACILSPTVLIFLGALSEYRPGLISEDLAGGIGTVILLLIIMAAVAVFILTAMKLAPFDFLEKQEFSPQYGVEGLAETRRQEFETAHRRCIVTGISLCIASVIPLLTAAAFQAGDFIYALMVDILFLLVAAGVTLLVWAGVVWGSCDKLLQQGDYTPEKKSAERKIEPLAGIYWCIVTAGFLAVSFITGRWDRTWIIWPCAAVLFAAFVGIVGLIKKTSR